MHNHVRVRLEGGTGLNVDHSREFRFDFEFEGNLRDNFLIETHKWNKRDKLHKYILIKYIVVKIYFILV